jgi:ATP-binding cassette subfamily B protein/subfamily B ATP-binding cassette protein MsbA
MAELPPKRPHTSRQRYRRFVDDYRSRRLDQLTDAARSGGSPDSDGGAAARKGKRRQFIRDYLTWLSPHRYRVGVVFLLAVTAAGLQLVEPLFMRNIIDRVLLNPTLDASARLTRLNLIGITFLAVIVLSNLASTFKDYRQRLLNVRVMLSLRRALFDRFLHLPLPRLWDMKTGGILSRLTGDIDTTTGLLQLAVISPSIAVIRLLVAIVILLTMNWRLALMAIAIIPGAMFISFTAARRVRPIYRSVRRDVEEIDGRVGETFSGIRVVRAFGREVRELAEYLTGRHTVLRKEMFAQRREMLLWTSWGLLLGIVNVVIIWYGGHLYLAGGATIGDIMAFQWFTFLLLNPVWSIVNSFSELQRSLAAMERVFDVLGMEDDKPDRPGAVDAPAIVNEIRFEDVEFEYREGQPVVRDFNVTVPGGSVVALVGRSGAGKTTVTDLVARFHDPTRGRILLNGQDIRDFKLRSYRDLQAIVQQDVFLFDGSVRDNIAYGRHGVTEAEVEDASRRANAHEFIERLPEQYETFIGERGVKLSGGQQQRLAIARAIVARPQILILDEGDEQPRHGKRAVDPGFDGRHCSPDALRLSSRTACRPSGVQTLILLMEDGRIIERGTHASLMAERGTYYEMVLRQMEHDRREGRDGGWQMADGRNDPIIPSAISNSDN